MKTILLFSIPPLMGAVIGFITNVIAIKMLFRPLKEIRVFGVRLPFTPGILPRQRHKLANSIGAMVERELLTPEIIRNRLQREEVKGGIKNSVSRYTEKILSKPLGEMLDAAPVSPFQDFALSLFQGFLSSPACDDLLEALSEALTEGLFSGDLPNRSFSEIAGPEQGAKIMSLAEQFAAEGIAGGAEKISAGLVPAMEQAYPRGTDMVIRFLKRRDIQEQMEDQGRVFLGNVILKLNVFQRLFISTAQYDKTLHERMPEIVDDLIGRLEELLTGEETRGKILRWGQESIRQILSDRKSAGRFARFVATALSGWMDKPLGLFLHSRGAGEVQAFIRGVLGGVKHAISLKGGSVAGAEGGTDAAGVSPASVSSLFGSLRDRLREKYGNEPLARLLTLEGEKKDALDSLLRDQILRVADEQIGAALRTINVRDMVAERIDSLDMIRVERIILDVMANQLKWIDIFGAILGFLIGLSQTFFAWLFR
jgi:hypothetical protein